jgi:hypothetical protein
LDVDIDKIINMVSYLDRPHDEKSACNKVGCLVKIEPSLIPNS